MKYVEAPNVYNGDEKSLFLAGGISNCPNWQQDLINLLRDEDIVILNPKRANFATDDPNATNKQITWEYNHLRKADAISFWFPKETLCPVALYELGTWSMTEKPIFVGMHPEYPRRQDVEIQIELVRPSLKILYSLESLSVEIENWIKS